MIERDEPCELHRLLNQERGGDKTIEEFRGDFAKLIEWGRQQGSYPDGCPSVVQAHYSLYYRETFIADASNKQMAVLLREMAERLETAG